MRFNCYNVGAPVFYLTLPAGHKKEQDCAFSHVCSQQRTFLAPALVSNQFWRLVNKQRENLTFIVLLHVKLQLKQIRYVKM